MTSPFMPRTGWPPHPPVETFCVHASWPGSEISLLSSLMSAHAPRAEGVLAGALHDALCPATQCDFWQPALQYLAVLHLPHVRSFLLAAGSAPQCAHRSGSFAIARAPHWRCGPRGRHVRRRVAELLPLLHVADAREEQKRLQNSAALRPKRPSDPRQRAPRGPRAARRAPAALSSKT